MVDGSSMIGFPLIIADIERDMPGSKPGPLGLHSYTDHKGRNKCGSVFWVLKTIEVKLKII